MDLSQTGKGWTIMLISPRSLKQMLEITIEKGETAKTAVLLEYQNANQKPQKDDDLTLDW